MTELFLSDEWWKSTRRRLRNRWIRRVTNPIERALFAWMETAEQNFTPGCRLIGESEDGDMLMPSRRRADYWEGYWRWWRPSHWPTYIRSRRARSYVMIELGYDDDDD